MKLNRNLLRIGLAPLAFCTLLAAASNSMRAAEPETATTKGEAFIIGTDAPLASVASFSVTIESIDAYAAGSTTPVPLLSAPVNNVDFARFNGLQTLLDISQVPVGSYDKIVVTISSPSLGYLTTAAGMPPAIQYMTPTLTTTTVTKHLLDPLTVTATEPIGLRMDFDLHKSIQVENGEFTGMVDPVFNIGVVRPNAPGAYIDEFDTAVISPGSSNDSFVVQGPHGRFWTIDTTGQTTWDGGTFASLNANTIVQISGMLDRSTSTISADEVSILSQNGFWAGGQLTYAWPSTSTGGSFDLFVRGLIPASGTGVQLGQIATVDLASTDKYFVRWSGVRLPESISSLIFNPSALVPGQSIGIGGPASGATDEKAVTVKRVTLREGGYVGKVVKGSVRPVKDTFQMKVDGFAGQLIPQTINVYLTGHTEFRYGYSGIRTISGGDLVRVVGLLLKDPATGDTILVGKYVDALD
jgi:hypothetical protein